MQARTTVPSLQFNLLLWALVALGAGSLSVLPISLLESDSSPPSATVASTSPLVAYLEFGRESDTLWLAEATHPSKRHKRMTIAHAAEYGIIPSLAPDRRSFAYTALPAGTNAPTPGTPAELWLASVEKGVQPRSLAQDVDLLVAPVWSPGGDILVFRRSSDYRLFALDLVSGQERQLVTGEGTALFPVAFTPDSLSLYYVRVSEAGSQLNAFDIATGDDGPVAKLADGLTRDWKLSPAGDRLAYLAMSLDSSRTASRAFVLDLNDGLTAAVGPDGDAFSPAWNTNGKLALGRLAETSDGAAFASEGQTRFTSPAKGFDVPLSFAPAGDRLAVRNFDGSSIVNPGRERLQIVGPDGSRKNITNAEVTFLGWIDP